MICKDILEAIGRTPMVRLNKLVEPGSAEVLVKLESTNPGGSIKDRAALEMVLDAEKRGLLKPGGTIIEPTSGNTGIGLAMVGAAKGYHVILTMPDTMSLERRKLIKAYGAEIILTPGSLGMQGAVDAAMKESEEKGYFVPYQFENPANSKAHRETTALEILEDTGGELNAFVAGVGTGGTFSGVGRVLRERVPGVQLYAVEPSDSPVLRGEPAAGHKIQGIGANFVPGIYEGELADEIMGIDSEEAMETARRMASKEGILCGISSGANVCAALKIAKKLGEGKRVVTILPDTGERYLTTELFQEGL